MQRRTAVSILLGALLGAVLGVSVLALAAGRVVGGGVGVADAGPAFQVGRGALNLLVLVAGAVGGAVLGLVGFAAGREAAPNSRRISMGPMAALGAGVGAAIAFGAARAALGAGADIEAGVVTLTVFRAGIVALVAGAVTGAIVGGTAERLSRPEALGLGGEAWPSSPVAFARDALTAVGLPGLGIVIGATLIWGFSEVLLQSDHSVGLVLFGGVSALILAGAAALAALPPRGGSPE